MPTPRRTVSVLVLVLSLDLAGAPATSRGQAPGPIPEATIPDVEQRSGLVMRQTPIIPHLPPDPKRDQWYDNRWGDEPNLNKRPNFYRNGGLYGLPWKANHTASTYPYFFGAPGRSTLNADVRRLSPLGRFNRSFLHPLKPVGMYYEQGSYVPVYDLDPLVPGPGPAPYVFPFYRRLTSAGG